MYLTIHLFRPHTINSGTGRDHLTYPSQLSIYVYNKSSLLLKISDKNKQIILFI